MAYNRRDEVLITLDNIKKLSPQLSFDLQIIVVDNASKDDTSEKVREFHPDVTLVTKAINNGIAGWNDGFAVAKHKYMLVLDDDSHVESGLEEAVNYLEKRPDIGILALNVTTGPYKTKDWGWKDGQEVLGFFGCGAIIRKEVYNKIGGFGEWLHVYAHEWEYGIRVLDAGYKNVYFENSKVIHRANPTNRSFRRLRVHVTRNEMGIIYKYFGKDRWKYIMRMFVNNLKLIKKGEFVRMYFDIVGTVNFLKMRKTLVHTPVRREVQDYFADNYMNTFPVFGFIGRRIKNAFKSKNTNNNPNRG